MATILLLLDAFRHDYLAEETTPFLWKCAREGEHFAGVEQSWGFCERSEILTGLRGDETGFFTAIGFDPVNSPYANICGLRGFHALEKAALPLLRLLPGNLGSRAHGRLRRGVSGYFRRRGITMPAYSIPYSSLPYFALTEDRIDHRDAGAFPSPSILALLETAGKTFYYDTFTALNFTAPYHADGERLDAVVRDAGEVPKDLYLVYIAAPDSVGHACGPESPEIRTMLRELDAGLERFVHELERVAPGNRYLFLGDHGMLTVTKNVDAECEIRRLLRFSGLRAGRDVLYFLDSTMVRFWAMSARARASLSDVLAASAVFRENGRWVDEAFARSHRIPWSDRRYGDYLWLAEPGVLVFPDFFHRLAPCRGMHGYDPALPESRGMCIHWGSGIPAAERSLLPLAGVFDLLKRNLGV